MLLRCLGSQRGQTSSGIHRHLAMNTPGRLKAEGGLQNQHRGSGGFGATLCKLEQIRLRCICHKLQQRFHLSSPPPLTRNGSSRSCSGLHGRQVSSSSLYLLPLRTLTDHPEIDGSSGCCSVASISVTSAPQRPPKITQAAASTSPRSTRAPDPHQLRRKPLRCHPIDGQNRNAVELESSRVTGAE